MTPKMVKWNGHKKTSDSTDLRFLNFRIARANDDSPLHGYAHKIKNLYLYLFPIYLLAQATHIQRLHSIFSF